MRMPHFVRPSVDGCLGSFYLLAIANNTAINMGTQISTESCFQFVWIYTWKRAARSYGNSVFNFVEGPLYCLA